MSALEQEIMQLIDQLDYSARRRVLDIIRKEMYPDTAHLFLEEWQQLQISNNQLSNTQADEALVDINQL